ncbi:prion-like-(Q/N-rich) domain-bearing protein 25 isoform X1 [Hermetia illucens]|nr:prion-like-(Q/N-rich) domain-bearing protein 25 isoform X1 [Hermetia illucens]
MCNKVRTRTAVGSLCSSNPAIMLATSVALASVVSLCLAGPQGHELSRRRTSNVCDDNSDCPMNAYCERSNPPSTGICLCHKGYIIISENGHRECFKAAATINDVCTYNEQCMITLSTESECLNNRCQCKEGTHYVQRENSCYKTSKIGDFCRLKNNCIIDEAVCRSGVCQCPYGKHANRDFTQCIRNVDLGQECSIDEECTDFNTRCLDICRCKISHTINKAGNKCLKVAEHLQDECEEDHQCTERIPYSVCDANYTCGCKQGYHQHNFKCWVSVPAGGICEATENCLPFGELDCIDGRCTCRNNLHTENGQCSFADKKNFSQRYLALIIIIYLFI